MIDGRRVRPQYLDHTKPKGNVMTSQQMRVERFDSAAFADARPSDDRASRRSFASFTSGDGSPP
ncbi:hypothetical protein GCM10010178_67600 [Lentzea flava]|uniref:Uncharacterized protein n=1 Tax=Lentzea flava TaxID=103732 RepID=A0ABQ2V389_9PSEU|nr:hypothetical protein GCM10010178_67600 [Lentzea flava]